MFGRGKGQQSLYGPVERASVTARAEAEADRLPASAATRAAPVVAGPRLVAAGGGLRPAGTAGGGRARRFLRWST
ncbi:hypothetical protein ACLGI4_28270 [Streptomyces sp. HMX112]|uniref:hypothetical protein n=1 Tax=Streptomyces sp. HMX112 TaxID=3390850 RepID=UPI003A80613C